MNRDQYNQFCATLAASLHVVQWGGADVWKVGNPLKNKVFAVAGWDNGVTTGITFKTTDMAFHILKEQPGLRPAPYLASRGMSWIQHHTEPGLTNAELEHYLRQSHALAAQNLTKKLQRELGLL